MLETSLLNDGVDKHIVSILMKSVKVVTVNVQNNTKSMLAIDSSKEKGVPQGIIVGNALAEIFAQQFDDDFISLENKGIKYHRFVDDIIIFYNSSIITDDELKNEANRIISKYKLTFNSKSSIGNPVSLGFSFLGFVFNNGLISVTDDVLKKKINKIERVIFDFHRSASNKIKNNYNYLIWKLNLEITGFVANKIFYGWTSSYRFVNDYAQYIKLDYITKMIYKRARLDDKYYADVKSFVKAHNSINKATRHKSGYIPNFDNMYPSVVEKRAFLIYLYNISPTSNDEYVEDLFDSVVKKEVFEIERDLDLKYGI